MSEEGTRVVLTESKGIAARLWAVAGRIGGSCLSSDSAWFFFILEGAVCFQVYAE